jgi:polo-like kinase 1
MQVKIGDFGLATKLDHERQLKKTLCGTPNYLAPELLEAKRGYSFKVDVWAIGVIIFTLLTGKPPFDTDDIKATYDRIRSNDYHFPEHQKISMLAKDLVRRILVTSPRARLDIFEVINHPFLNGPGYIPKTLCSSLLIVPPTPQYIQQFECNYFHQNVLQNFYDDKDFDPSSCDRIFQTNADIPNLEDY